MQIAFHLKPKKMTEVNGNKEKQTRRREKKKKQEAIIEVVVFGIIPQEIMEIMKIMMNMRKSLKPKL